MSVRPAAGVGHKRPKVLTPSRLLIFCAAGISAAVAVWFALSFLDDQESEIIGPASTQPFITAGETRRDRQHSPKDHMKKLLDPHSLWASVEPAAIDASNLPTFQDVDMVEDKALVRLVDPLHQREVGDSLAVSIPQLGETYRAVVERVKYGPGNAVAMSGRITDGDRQHIFVYTTGPDAAFAHVGTAHGTFELYANGEIGWLMPTANMDQHVDYSVPDYFVVSPDDSFVVDTPTNILQ